MDRSSQIMDVNLSEKSNVVIAKSGLPLIQVSKKEISYILKNFAILTCSVHFCTVQVPDDVQTKAPELYDVVFYDIETLTDRQTGRLQPYLVCLIVHCEMCLNNDDEDCPRKKEIYIFFSQL